MLGGETITRTTLQHAREMLGKHTGDAPAQTTAFV
jgi:DNA repair ATPase RecN